MTHPLDPITRHNVTGMDNVNTTNRGRWIF
jgi:hypothetical protein